YGIGIPGGFFVDNRFYKLYRNSIYRRVIRSPPVRENAKIGRRQHLRSCDVYREQQATGIANPFHATPSASTGLSLRAMILPGPPLATSSSRYRFESATSPSNPARSISRLRSPSVFANNGNNKSRCSYEISSAPKISKTC